MRETLAISNSNVTLGTNNSHIKSSSKISQTEYQNILSTKIYHIQYQNIPHIKYQNILDYMPKYFRICTKIF